MNAARWDASTDPWDMWNAAGLDCSVRQQGLWALACVERIRELLPPVGTEIIAAVEESLERSDYLVGQVDAKRWTDALNTPPRPLLESGLLLGVTLYAPEPKTLQTLARDLFRELCGSGSVTGPSYRTAVGLVADIRAVRETEITSPTILPPSQATNWLPSHAWPAAYGAVWRREQAVHANLLREVRGNPFRPVAFLPAWRTDTVVALARAMYDSRNFGAMPILADALQDAGCENEHILNHCRDTAATHVRGCWVLDGVLGKS